MLCLLTVGTYAQTPLIDIQGETDVSPFEGQEVTINALVTEYFGDTWFMQDAFGAWNGIYVDEPTLMVPPNPPWWAEDRQPEVGDELTITGTVYEVDGNTQLMDAVLVEQTNWWMATSAGTATDAADTQVESLEGTRVRLLGMTVVTQADDNDEWIIMDGSGEVTCIGIDDEADPFPGDVYDVFGAMIEVNGEYKVMIGDIDVISLSVEEKDVMATLQPNPMTHQMLVNYGAEVGYYSIHDMCGRVVRTQQVNSQSFVVERGNLASGSYVLRISTISGIRSHKISVQ